MGTLGDPKFCGAPCYCVMRLCISTTLFLGHCWWIPSPSEQHEASFSKFIESIIKFLKTSTFICSFRKKKNRFAYLLCRGNQRSRHEYLLRDLIFQDRVLYPRMSLSCLPLDFRPSPALPPQLFSNHRIFSDLFQIMDSVLVHFI